MYAATDRILVKRTFLIGVTFPHGLVLARFSLPSAYLSEIADEPIVPKLTQ